jgi:hypothetical protein
MPHLKDAAYVVDFQCFIEYQNRQSTNSTHYQIRKKRIQYWIRLYIILQKNLYLLQVYCIFVCQLYNQNGSMEKQHLLKQIASLEKARQKLLTNFQKIAQKDDDNTLNEAERIDSILDIIKEFDKKINMLKTLIKEGE